MARELMDSLTVDKEIERAWRVEVARRVDEILSGKAVGKSAEQLFAELEKEYP